MFNSKITKVDLNYNSMENQLSKTISPFLCFQNFRINCINRLLNYFPINLKKNVNFNSSIDSQIVPTVDPIISYLRNQFYNQFKTHETERQSLSSLSYNFSPQPLLMMANQGKEAESEILPTTSICALCGRIFRFEKNLQRHLERNHSAVERESLLKCKMCHYTTRHYSNMYVHIRTHTGDKPYYCSACGASFTQGSSLKLHIKSRHQDNMKFFALSKKPRKSNLTKLWSRVYKSDLDQISPINALNPCRQSTSSLIISPNIWSGSESVNVIDKKTHKHLFNMFSRNNSSLIPENVSSSTENEKLQTVKKLPYSVQFMIE